MIIKHGFFNKHFVKKTCKSYLLYKFSLFENKEKFQEIFCKKLQNVDDLYKDIIILKSIQQEINF